MPSVIYEKKDGIAYITLNRPEAMNAINLEMGQALTDAWFDFRDDPEMRVAVITGAGEKAFSAGADLKQGLGAPGRTTVPGKEGWVSPIRGKPTWMMAFLRDMEIWKPIIAAINGYCYAGAFEMALACDIRLASPNASFAMAEAKWGMFPEGGGMTMLPRLIPRGVALEMFYTAKPITVQRAYELGLVNKIVPLEDLLPTATEMAKTICENGPLSIRSIKECAYKTAHMSIQESLHFEHVYGDPVMNSDDAKEGPRAFVEKRKPNFKGR